MSVFYRNLFRKTILNQLTTTHNSSRVKSFKNKSKLTPHKVKKTQLHSYILPTLTTHSYKMQVLKPILG